MLLLFLSLLAASGLLEGATIPPHFKEEGHKILKRFVDHQEYDGHDIAHVLHKRHPDTFHHISRRDLTSVVNPEHHSEFSTLRLDMASSQDSLTLNLKKRSIVDDSTEFVSLTNQGRVRRSPSVTGDCFATGHAEGSPNEVAAVSMCKGLHGVASSNGFDYYIHPVESDMSDEEHQVHVLWRRSADDESASIDPVENDISDEDRYLHIQWRRSTDDDDTEPIVAAPTEAWMTETNMTIEFALFTDAKSWQKLQTMAPGREDEHMLVTMAATNALYGDKNKVGYDVIFKVKLLEFWEVDPEEYDFQESLQNNLGSFCRYTREKYVNPSYDMHILHTGITQQDGPAVGMAYMSGVCGRYRCGNCRLLNPNRYLTLAHEVGHNLGFHHHYASKCPEEIKSLGGGFMGDGYLDFSPCNKWELQELFSSGKGSCLFEETIKNSESYDVDRARVLPGQSRSPDKLCELYAGFGYTYFRPYPLYGDEICKTFLCMNTDKDSTAYKSIVQFDAPRGFPCADEKLCLKSCKSWVGSYGWDIDYLRTLKRDPEWSSWPEEWSECSSTCGVGVQVKERKCLVEEGSFVSPYCIGSSVKVRPCVQAECDDEPVTAEELRKTSGDRICAAFFENNVQLSHINFEAYLPVFIDSNNNDRSCLVACTREDNNKEKIDGVFENGTPCQGGTRSSYDLERFGIEMRCANGKCLELSDCQDNELKDNCGICRNEVGYNESLCITETISDDNANLTEGERVVIATFPAGSSGIDVEAVSMKNGRLELWTGDESGVIWGEGGQYQKKKYNDNKRVSYAGTLWSLSHKKYARADGPTNEDVVLKWLVGTSPSKKVKVNYLMP